MPHLWDDMKRNRFHPTMLLLLGCTLLSTAQETEVEKHLKDLEKASVRLHGEGEDLFAQGRYWECARDLIILIDFFPDYSRIDEVFFMLGESLYEIGLYDGSSKMYKHLVKNHVRSPLLAHALLGLQRIQFDRDDHARCIEFYKAIIRCPGHKDAADAARYYAGRSYFVVKDYPQAIQLLTEISEASPFFDYGFYTAGLALIRMKKVEKAIEMFRSICRLPVVNEERREVIDEAHKTLGYIYFELGYYSYALRQFEAVSPDHSRYQEALLAAGWSALKMGDFVNAVDPLTELVRRHPADEHTEEALFLLGRCYLKMARYDEALKIYEHLIAGYPEQRVPPGLSGEIRRSLVKERGKLEKSKMDLLMLESKLLETIPLNGSQRAPGFLGQHDKDVTKTRELIMDRILNERARFETLSEEMEKLERLTEVQDNQRDWRAYAEYGKSRVLFLQSKSF